MSCAVPNRRPSGGGVLRSRWRRLARRPRSRTDAAKNAGTLLRSGCRPGGRWTMPMKGCGCGGFTSFRDPWGFPGAGGQLEIYDNCADESGGTDAKVLNLLPIRAGDARGPGGGSRYDPRGFGPTGRDLGAGEYGAERFGGGALDRRRRAQIRAARSAAGNRWQELSSIPGLRTGVPRRKWILEDNIGEMLECCARLLEPRGRF